MHHFFFEATWVHGVCDCWVMCYDKKCNIAFCNQTAMEDL